MAAGLLIKAFALFLLPLLLAPLLVALTRSGRSAVRLTTVSFGIVLLLAGPWYMRNFILYRSVTAAYDSLNDVTLGQVVKAALSMPWPGRISEMVHSALWTGNNSITAFSSSTLILLLALLLVALVLFGLRLQRTIAELVVVSSIALYAVGLVELGSPSSPCCCGVIWRAATWLAKLIPQYGGFGDSRTQPRALWNWYAQSSALRDSILRNLCPAPLPALYGLLLLVITSLLAACVLVLIGLVQDQVPRSARSASGSCAEAAAPRAYKTSSIPAPWTLRQFDGRP